MFTYSQVESALARANRVPAQSLGAFRGRIKHFQRLGMVPASPGKGTKISYTREHVYSWAICLELAQFGIDPTIIKVMLWSFDDGRFLKNLIQKAIESTKESYFVFYPNLASNPFKTDVVEPWDSGGGYSDDNMTYISTIIHSLDELKEHPELDLMMTRLAMINLSHVLREVEKALEEVAK